MTPKTPNGHKILCIAIYLLWFKIYFFLVRRYPRPIYVILTPETKQEHILLNFCRDKMTISDKYGCLTKDVYLTIVSWFRAFWVNYICVIRRNTFTCREGFFFSSPTLCVVSVFYHLYWYILQFDFFNKNTEWFHFLKALRNVLPTHRSILSLSKIINYVTL